MADDMDRPYAGQEGEINDKLLLDLAWERQQKKVRTLLSSSRGRVRATCANCCVRQFAGERAACVRVPAAQVAARGIAGGRERQAAELSCCRQLHASAN